MDDNLTPTDCFQCTLHFRRTPEQAHQIIAARVILHPNVTIKGEQDPTIQMEDPDEDPIHDRRLEQSNEDIIHIFIWSYLFITDTKAKVLFSFNCIK